MSWTAATTANRELNLRQAAGLTASGAIAFHLTIFGSAALALWLVLAFWIALFGVLARLCLIHCCWCGWQGMPSGAENIQGTDLWQSQQIENCKLRRLAADAGLRERLP